MKLVLGLVLWCTVSLGASLGQKHNEVLANIQTYPWTVYLIGTNNIRCGGSIISPNVVLSSAFCEYATPITIIFGTQNLIMPLFTRTVTEEHVFSNIQGNLLLLRITDITFGLSVQSIRLPKYSEIGFNQWIGYIAYLPGFSDTVNSLLTLAHMKLVAEENCIEHLNLDLFPPNSICGEGAHRLNDGLNISGAGTPLSIVEEDGAPTLIGIFLQSNAGSKSPSLFISIEYDLDWIYDITDVPFRY